MSIRISKVICALGAFALVLSLMVGCSPSAGEANSAFDGDKAFALLKKQVDIGPRYPGVPGHEACGDLIVSQLKPLADDVSVQEFRQTVAGKDLTLRNIVAVFNKDAKQRIILAAHWDTRPVADMEIDASKRSKPILGANDGASGVAVLLELARVFSQHKPNVGVMLVFFDGEDYTPNPPTSEDMFLGSKYFAKNLDSKIKSQVKYGILLDMVGDKSLDIAKETQSVVAAPEVVKNVWEMADSLGYGKHFVANQISISDDHIPLIRSGIKCIDVIDFNYGPWHTLDDTTDKCSRESLKIVGDVIAHVVYKESAS